MEKNTPYKGPTYTKVPNKAFELLAEMNLSAANILVYFSLCKYYNMEKNESWPSLNTLAKSTGLGLTSIKQSLNILCSKGMILRAKMRSKIGDYDNNIYYIPHFIKFQIEYLLEDKKNLKKNKRLIQDLKALDNEITEMVNEQMRRSKNDLPRSKNDLPGSKNALGRSKNADGVGLNTPTNYTIENKNQNIIINVQNNDENLTSELSHLKNFKRNRSLTTQPIGEIKSLVDLKKEGFAQEIAAALNDYKSISFFRSLISKLGNHEDVIYKCLSLTKETDEITGINKTRGAVFTDHVKREAKKIGIEI